MTPSAGAILPHAPVLLPELSGPRLAAQTGTVRAAVRSLDFNGARAAVVISPHADATGVYRTVAGGLRESGVGGYEVECDTDEELAARLASAWAAPLLDGPVDHGVVVAARLLELALPLVAVGLSGRDGGSAPALARALREIQAAIPIAVVATVHTSLGLGPRSPRPDLLDAERRVRSALEAAERDAGALAELGPEFEAAASCGPQVLGAFGTAFAGHKLEVVCHETSLGVGYLVAQVGT